jgi:molybdenum cofactor synthesis domain-containing protein
MATASIVTIGNEIVSGDVPNTNASWLAQRLERLGIDVQLLVAVPDEIPRIAELLRAQAREFGIVIVTGGLGGTPDDVTREALAATFGVDQEEHPEVAAELRARFHRDPGYAVEWARLPVGSRPLENPLGGAPGFVIENVYVLPGLPAEMEAMFEIVERELPAERPIGSWRGKYRTTESQIVSVLRAAGERHSEVRVGSYPSFGPSGSEVEVVLKSNDPAALAAATAWIEQALADAIG